MAEALYRKYRPQVFDDVVGQEHIERTLKNAVGSNRVSHAYLFTGPRGTGKTTTARLLSKALLCEHGPTSNPCGVCEDCRLIAEGVHPDVYELDAASRTGVDNVRDEIIGRVQYAPTRGRFKVYIIDEVHMLSTAAFNALLKTLEEPPSHVVFILCTTDPQKVPETIQSRCQRFDFRRISAENIVLRLGAICVAEGVEFEGEALDLIAQRAEGGMRDALTTLEQLIVYGEGKVTLSEAERLLGALDVDDMAAIVDAIGRRDAAAGFRWTARYVETGADIAQFAQDLAQRFRDLYVFAILGADAVVEVTEVERRQIAQELAYFGVDRLSHLLGIVGDLLTELRTSANPRLSFEIALTRMARPESDLTLEALAARVEELERGAVRVAPVDFAGANGASVEEERAHQAQPASPRAVEASSQIPEEPVRAAQASEDASGASCVAVEAPQPAETESQPAGEASRPEGGASQPASSASQPAIIDLTNSAALQRAWRQALALVKKEKTAYGVLFMNTKASYDGAQLRIAFSSESDFAFKAVQKPDVSAILERAIRQVFGADIPFSFVLERAATSQAEPAPQAVERNGQPASRPAPQRTQAAPRPEPAPQPEAAPQQAAPRPEPAPQPEPQPEPATQAAPQQAAPQPEPQPQQVAPALQPAPADDFDEVPLDAYEGFYGGQDDGSFDDEMTREEREPQSESPAEDAELNRLQEALSLFGNIKIEEI